ncbi:MAG: hypothetical protein HEQ40_14820 [Lacibacter sp.]|jgi:hypothetical protein
MKKILLVPIVLLTLFVSSVNLRAQEGIPETGGGGCNSYPNNNGKCRSYTKPDGSTGYSCLQSEDACKDCFI